MILININSALKQSTYYPVYQCFKNLIYYYTNCGSQVFACFVDFAKASDRVNNWKFLNLLYDDRINV